MLRELSIHNLKLVEHAHISFIETFQVITGESGAGKSMILSSLKLILGEKTPEALHRDREQKVRVQALFSFPAQHPVWSILEELSIEVDEDELLIRREIDPNNRSKTFVNDHLITLKQLKRLGEQLIDLHGQHEHQSLLNDKTHLPMCDAYWNTQTELAAYQKSYKRYLAAKQDYQDILQSSQTEQQELDYIRFQVEELNQLQLKPDEYETLQAERNRLKHAVELNDLLEAIPYILNGDGGLMESIQSLTSKLNQLSLIDSQFKKNQDTCYQANIALEELSQEFLHYTQSESLDPNQLDHIETRLYALENAKRKYQRDILNLMDLQKELEVKLDRFENRDEHLLELQEQMAQYQKEAQIAADALHKKRLKGKNKLEAAVTQELQELGMSHAQFKLDWSQTEELTVLGQDKIHFLLSANKGHNPQALARIASGGEISRIMLALKSIFAQSDPIETLIFDEIDANLGGQTALVVGEKLQKLAHQKQMICITHLAQIASKASAQFLVSKSDKDVLSRTDIKELNETERVKEIARMLGGDVHNQTALTHAEELITL